MSKWTRNRSLNLFFFLFRKKSPKSSAVEVIRRETTFGSLHFPSGSVCAHQIIYKSWVGHVKPSIGNPLSLSLPKTQKIEPTSLGQTRPTHQSVYKVVGSLVSAPFSFKRAGPAIQRYPTASPAFRRFVTITSSSPSKVISTMRGSKRNRVYRHLMKKKRATQTANMDVRPQLSFLALPPNRSGGKPTPFFSLFPECGPPFFFQVYRVCAY